MGPACTSLPREAHSFCWAHFCVYKTLQNLQLLAFYSQGSWVFYLSCFTLLLNYALQLETWIISATFNANLAIESISMDFTSSFLMTQCQHDCIFVVVYWFCKMGIFIPCTKMINAHTQTNWILQAYTESLWTAACYHLWMWFQICVIFSVVFGSYMVVICIYPQSFEFVNYG